MSTTPWAPETTLLPEQEELLRQLETTLQTDPASETTQAFHIRALAVLDANKQKKSEPVNEYVGIAAEHADFIKTHNSLEIAGWLGEKLGIESWKSGAFLGERKVLTTPTPEEMARLQQFTQALGKSWTPANGWSDNHSQFFLMDGYIQNTLFGQANMAQVDARLNTFHTDWQAMKKDFAAKAQYLKDKVGLDIKGDWSKLTGIRFGNGGFVGSDVLYASGGLDGVSVHGMWLNRAESDVDFSFASSARLCFLA